MFHAYLLQLRLTPKRRVRVKLIIFRNLIINQHNHIAMRSFPKGLAHILQKPVNVLLHPVLGEMPLAPSTSVNPRGGSVKNIPDAYKPETTLSTVTCRAFPLLELHQEHLDDLHLHPSSGTIAKFCARPANEMPQPLKSALPSPQPHPRIWDPMSSPPTKITNDRKSKTPSPLLRIMHQCNRQRLKSAAQSASVPEIERLLDRISPRLPDAEQIVLEFSAMKGNADVSAMYFIGIRILILVRICGTMRLEAGCVSGKLCWSSSRSVLIGILGCMVIP